MPHTSASIRSRVVCTLLGLCWSTLLFAGSIELHPVSLNLSTAVRIGSVFVHNSAPHPAVLQLSLRKWQQKAGKDAYTTQKSLIVTPPIITLAPHQGQVIRVGLMHPTTSTTEQAYRLYLQEIPEHNKKKIHSGFTLALRIGVPIFIAPTHPHPPTLQWAIIERTQKKHPRAWMLRVTNRGNVHTRITKIALTNPGKKRTLMKENTLTYVLPGQSHTWTIKNLQTLKPLGHPLVRVTTNWGTLVAQPHMGTPIVQNAKKPRNV